MSLARFFVVLLGILLLVTFVQTLIERSHATIDQNFLTTRSAPESLRATPSFGTSPLMVEFSYGGPSSNCRVNFGDGKESGLMLGEVLPGGTYSGYLMTGHTYTSAGMYTATLTDCNTQGTATIIVY